LNKWPSKLDILLCLSGWSNVPDWRRPERHMKALGIEVTAEVHA
jgi:hypothetical protein